MKAFRVAVIGFGKVGRACAVAVKADEQLELAGVVRRPETVDEKLPPPFGRVPTATHVGELAPVDAALICVPTAQAHETAQSLLRQGTGIVECADLHGEQFRAHRDKLGRLAAMHGTKAIVGAGWDPGALSLFRGLFALLIPRGHMRISHHTAPDLHHTTAVRAVAGVREALSTEVRTPEGKRQRYVYVELDEDADPGRVGEEIRGDPLYLGEETQVFPVENIRDLEEEGLGLLMERRGSLATDGHPMLLLEARIDAPASCAAVMVAAARSIPACKEGAFSLFDLPPGHLWGALKWKAEKEWM